jgi:hypothetical protein
MTKGILKINLEKELVEEILIYLQFIGLHDKKVFTKKDLLKEQFEEIVTWIQPYYIPCKAKRFLYDLDESKQITILRHILRSVGYDLLVQVKLINSMKVTTYQIYQKFHNFDLSGNYIVDFS